ncbi:nudix hydrolase 14, chloroplastic [Dendrobium catenatum]|uniref:Nudix hydrolase 14, chloroplastic n=1 Tax=Dendrobium catenatum TaxID=906689 RepID=A0A2I0WBS6_9ASPA|nr:nudix hydrolase 14, chloroplastic [Dendrobium catenatum]PKU73108.1 Nudix hydrolase 14, chloroplastic [Dendrobium catenatum]
MTASARLLFYSVLSIHRQNHRDLHHFLPLSSGITATKTLCCRRRIRFSSQMASGGMQAPTTSTQTMRLPNGEFFEISAASGVSESEFRIAIESALFKQWLKNMQSEKGLLAGGQMHLQHVEVQGIDMFGNSIGFLKFKAEVFDKQTGMKVPGIVFARGPSVAVLILLESEEDTFVVLTEQVRVPVGKLILELPAGMVDDEGGDVVGTAVREVEEETGIKLNVQDMVNLTAFLDPTTSCKVFPSPGGCDEELSLFLYKGNVKKEIIKALQGKEMGLRDHGELIKVHVVPYDKLWRITADAKALSAVALYEMAKRDGLL